MLHNPMSAVVWSRPTSFGDPASAFSSSTEPPEVASVPRVLRPSDRQILALLGDHGVLTSGQLVVLSGMPERTVQYRLGRLERSGLLNRLRPLREVGTSPYHCWLRPFGAAAVGAQSPRAWRDDPAGVQAVAALSHLFLAVREHAEGGGLYLAGWRRLPEGQCFCDPRTGTVRELPAEAELTVTGGRTGTETTMLVVAQVEGVPTARLEAVLARFAGLLATTPGTRHPLLGVLARTWRVAERVLVVAAGLDGAPAARRLDPPTLSLARRRIAVGVVEPHPAGLATEPVWSTPGDRRARRLVEVVAEGAGGAR
jgi:DNA-binding transcriptional ArsR family regulator